MSLIITSNVNLEDENTQSNIFKPYSYTNSLNNNTLKIPANSEIALQSCKINKSGVYTLSRLNNIFGVYFGKKLVSGTFDLANSTVSPMIGNIGDLNIGDYIETNVRDLADQIEIGMKNVISHPAVIRGLDTQGNINAGLVCNASYNATSDFQGYNWVLTQHTANEETTTSLDVDVGVTCLTAKDDNGGTSYTLDNGVFTNLKKQNIQVRCDAYPITNNGFKLIAGGNAGAHKGIVFDIQAANNVTASRWIVGLVRPNIPSDFDADNDAIEYLPTYFESNYSSHNKGTLQKNQFYDYCVRRVGTQLRIFQSCIKGGRTTGNSQDLVMNPITYWGFGGNFDAEYNIGTNASNFRYIKFAVSNEKMVIQISADKVAWLDLLNQDQRTTPAKDTIPTPINCTQWHLFPAMSLERGTSITMSDFYTYEIFDDTYDIFNEKFNWWVKICNAGISETFGRDVETRIWNDIDNSTVREPLGVDQHLVMEDSQLIFTLAPSTDYGQQITQPCNTQFTLGFVGRSIVDTLNSFTNTTQTINSDNVPKLISNVSLFVRLNNFTQNSTNARRGTSTSKIVAHLPRFDNSGNETGGLYFEPQERVYLKLNNTNELTLNQLDVDIVYDNEQLCTAITGKTIIVFHLRESK
jgi:hypothetical protein